MDFVYANENHSTIINEKNGVVFLTFPKLVKAGVCHGFSTRIGGVSEGHLSSMNLSFTRGDDPEKVQENFRRIGAAIGFDAKDLVLSSQIHETEIRKVTAKDKGDGIVRETVPGIDALVTDEAGIPMYTSYADCSVICKCRCTCFKCNLRNTVAFCQTAYIIFCVINIISPYYLLVISFNFKIFFRNNYFLFTCNHVIV